MGYTYSELYYQRFLTPNEKFNLKYKVNKDNGCWEWTDHKNRGYGKFKMNKRERYAHAVSYEFYIGDIPKGMVICHKCDNPPCVNPFHLFLGTYKENMEDAQRKGRVPKATCPSYARYQKGCRCKLCVYKHREKGRDFYRKNYLKTDIFIIKCSYGKK